MQILILGNDNNQKTIIGNKQTLVDWQHLCMRAWQGDCALEGLSSHECHVGLLACHHNTQEVHCGGTREVRHDTTMDDEIYIAGLRSVSCTQLFAQPYKMANLHVSAHT